jgi:hypothetical protein
MMSLKDLKEHHYTKQGGTPCINQRIRPHSTAQNKPEMPLWAECGVPQAGDAPRRPPTIRIFLLMRCRIATQMGGYDK